MRRLILFSPIFFFISSYAQPELTKPIKLMDKFVNFYNQKLYDSVFNLFSDEMRAALPIDKTIEFFSNLQSQATGASKCARP